MEQSQFAPAGYMAKRTVCRHDWLKAELVKDIYSLSGCISQYFTDYIPHWRHNGWWLFDEVGTIDDLIRSHKLNQENLMYFYYEVYLQEHNQDTKEWRAIAPHADFHTSVNPPAKKQLMGYDVVSFYAQTSPECSPLSCNNLASSIATNEHCLLPDFITAKSAIEGGNFAGGEPGPLRVFAVYMVEGQKDFTERLRFRSHHRGTKEMDLLLGSFAARHLDSFSPAQLAEYDALLGEQDQDLYDWLLGRSAPSKSQLSSVLRLFLQHKFAG